MPALTAESRTELTGLIEEFKQTIPPECIGTARGLPAWKKWLRKFIEKFLA